MSWAPPRPLTWGHAAWVGGLVLIGEGSGGGGVRAGGPLPLQTDTSDETMSAWDAPTRDHNQVRAAGSPTSSSAMPPTGGDHRTADAEVANELGLDDFTLGNWVRQRQADEGERRVDHRREGPACASSRRRTPSCAGSVIC
jgi:hypothetical protein